MEIIQQEVQLLSKSLLVKHICTLSYFTNTFGENVNSFDRPYVLKSLL